MPQPFSSPTFDWPGVSLVHRFFERRRGARADAVMREVLGAASVNDRTPDLIRAALRQGADPNRAHTFPQVSVRPLDWAVEHRRFDLVVDLLDAGALPDAGPGIDLPMAQRLYPAVGPIRVTPLTATLHHLTRLCHDARDDSGIAWRRADRQAQDEAWVAIDAFIERGANPWRAGPPVAGQPLTTPLHLMAAAHPSLRGLQENLLRQLDPRRTDAQGDTAAHVVARLGKGEASWHPTFAAEVATGLLALESAGADLLHRNPAGDTPLDLLVRRVRLHPHIDGEMLPSSLVALHSGLPFLRWDIARPDGGPSPMAVLEGVLATASVRSDPDQAAHLQAMMVKEEARGLQRLAQETLARQDRPTEVRARARL